MIKYHEIQNYINPSDNLTIYFDKTFDYIVACNSANGVHRRALCGLSFKEVTTYFTQEEPPAESESISATNTNFLKGTKMEQTTNITLTFGFNELSQAVGFIEFASKHNLECSTLQNNQEVYFVELPHGELPKLLGYLGGDSRERFAVETLVRVCKGNL